MFKINHAKQGLLSVLSIAFFTVASGCSSHSNIAVETAENTPSKEVAEALGNLTIATWNVEHLAFPYDKGCTPRDAQSMSELKKYAASIEADVIGLQEVASEQAVRQLFDENEWQIVMSARPDSKAYECRGSGFQSTQQKVAFVVKKGIDILETVQQDTIGLGNPGLRYGLEITVASDLGNVSILNLHMKSGCFVDDFSQRDSSSCQTLGQQVEILDNWVEQKELAGQPYAILGDMNHRLSAPYNQMTRILTENSDGSDSTLNIVTAPIIGCHPRYPAPIDHVILGHLKGSSDPKMWFFDDMAEDAMLSDHCAISVSISAESYPLSQSVKWQTTSKEYEYITLNTYEQARNRIKERALPDSAWVVVMDVDETILDNSQYQVERESKGLGYTSSSWDKWVKRQEATLVPGAKEFIEQVLSLGGKLALITNREKSTDAYTWKNLTKLGVPVSLDNTCLLGREEADEHSVSRPDIVNDKDVRRMHVKNGTATCFHNGSGQSSWQQAHQILMQVGDNIEDIEAVSQDGAEPASLLLRDPQDIVILPNPMYGSW